MYPDAEIIGYLHIPEGLQVFDESWFTKNINHPPSQFISKLEDVNHPSDNLRLEFNPETLSPRNPTNVIETRVLEALAILAERMQGGFFVLITKETVNFTLVFKFKAVRYQLL